MPYKISRYYNGFAVYKWTYNGDCGEGKKVSAHGTYEQARDEAYRLNGEYLKGLKK